MNKGNLRRATIKEVAQAAGVSIATVSRILNSQSGVSEALKEQVLRAVRELHYQPNAVARALKVQKSRSIGLIIPDIENPFFPALVRSVEDSAKAQGYSLILCNTDGKPAEESKYIKFLFSKQVDGILFVGNSAFSEADKWLLNVQTPIVLLDRRIVGLPLSTVMVDNQAGAFMAVEHLIKMGRKRIALVGGKDTPTNSERLAGYKQALQAYGIAYAPELVTQGAFNFDGGYAGIERLLRAGCQFDAVFAANDMMAIGAVECLAKNGIAVPDDVAVVGFDDIRMAAWYKPALSTIRQPVYEMGRLAVTTLLEQIADPAAEPKSIMLCPELVVRQSSGERGDHDDKK